RHACLSEFLRPCPTDIRFPPLRQAQFSISKLDSYVLYSQF
ncbi:MAG: hypothetical protein ACI92S_004780, partial [Planctomycetaceae bacterium]